MKPPSIYPLCSFWMADAVVIPFFFCLSFLLCVVTCGCLGRGSRPHGFAGFRVYVFGIEWITSMVCT